jgi:hypothetical protein
MAEKRTIELEIQDNSKSLKAQYREAVAELQKVSAQYGETSEQAVKAAKAAAELKDQIGFSKDLVDSFNPDAKFNALSRSVGGVLDGFQAFEGALGLVGVDAEKLQETMVRLQSVMALSQGLQGLMEAKDSFKQLGTVAANALKGIRTGIAATGIGVFVVALGTVVAYWDDIKTAVSGVSDEQKKLNLDAQKNLKTSKEQYDNLQLQENSLKLQGKSEKEILKIKIDKLNASIELAEVEIKRLEKTSKLEIEAAKRNQEITKAIIQGALNFSALGLRLLLAPIDMVLETANLVSEKLGFGKITATNLNKEITKLIDFGAEVGSKFLFDPAQVKADSDAVIKEAQQGLNQMKSDRDGFLLQLKQGNDQSNKGEKENAKERVDLTRDIIDKQIELMEDGYEKERRILEEKAKREKEDLLANAKDKIVDQKQLAETQKLIEDNLKKDLKALNSKYFDGELDARAFSIEALKNDKIKELEIEVAANEEKSRIQKEYDEKEKERIKQLNQDKLQLAKDGLQLVSDLASLFGQQDEKRAKLAFRVDKAAKISSATIAGYEAVLEAYKTGQKSPLTAVFPAYPYIQAGLAGAFAAVNIAKISQAKFQSSGGGGGLNSPAGGGGGAAAPMTANFTTIGSSGINQLAQLQQTPTQAYVVSSEVTSAQALDRNRVQNATL